MEKAFSFKIKGDRGMRYSTFAIVFVIFGFVFCIDSISLFYKFLFAIIFNNLFLQAEVQPKSKHRNNQLTYQYYAMLVAVLKCIESLLDGASKSSHQNVGL